MSNPLLALAKRVQTLEKRVRTLGSTSQLAYSSIEGGAVSAFNQDGSQVMTIGRQWDGTYVATSQNGPTPPTPTSAVVTEGIESLTIGWNGLFSDALYPPMDFLRVDIHIGSTIDFVPTHSNRKGSITASTGGVVTVGLPAPFTYFVKLVCWSQAGAVSPASTPIEADTWTATAGSDGFEPASSPDPDVLPGIESMIVRWLAILNADPVVYKIYVSATSGFTPGPDTYVGETSGSQFTIRRLPGPPPLPGDPDERALLFGTDYYVKIVASDTDGDGPASTEAIGYVFQIPAGYLAADSVTAREVVSGTFTGSEFAGEVFIGSQFKTASTGQRVEWGVAGIQGYKSDGTRRFNVPTNDSEDIFLDAQIVARGLQVKGGASFEGNQNEITKDGTLNLASGVATPTGQPQIAFGYDTVKLDTTTVKTGPLGDFTLNPAEVNFISYVNSRWNVYQIKGTGTRVWRFNLDGSYQSHTDFGDYIFLGETFIPGDSNGYILFRYTLSGQHYVFHNNGIMNTYSPSAGFKALTIGNDGTNFFIAEVNSSNQVQIGVRTAMNPTAYGPLPAPSSTVTTTGTAYGPSKITVMKGSFDYGATRWIVSDADTSSTIRTANSTGAWIDGEFWESPVASKRGLGWDGSNFWTLGPDGYMYKHTTNKWVTPTTSNYWWIGLSLKASGPGYQTALGPKKSVRMNKRSRLIVTLPPMPYAGDVNDPDRWVIYGAVDTSGTGTTPPVTLWKQVEVAPSVPSWAVDALAGSGTAHPTTNTFPGANPGKIRNYADTLSIDADGKIKGVELYEGSTRVALQGPFYYAHLNADTSWVNNAWAAITTWTLDEASGITRSGGTFTVPIAGRYRVTAVNSFAANTTGLRGVRPVVAGSARINVLVPPITTFQTTAQVSAAYRMTAGQTISIEGFQNSGAALNLRGDSVGLFTIVQIDYVGP